MAAFDSPSSILAFELTPSKRFPAFDRRLRSSALICHPQPGVFDSPPLIHRFWFTSFDSPLSTNRLRFPLPTRRHRLPGSTFDTGMLAAIERSDFRSKLLIAVNLALAFAVGALEKIMPLDFQNRDLLGSTVAGSRLGLLLSHFMSRFIAQHAVLSSLATVAGISSLAGSLGFVLCPSTAIVHLPSVNCLARVVH